ncbi:hypothetical protein BKA56DRAFT_611460 [Ilyonectria sp. MPI-CAGE-AT-0026]|nr:hypothetical protein BKA56DRAFT_611460 [Ilyonectria sp. MPI-CAGE-AT-0026]
MRFLSVGPGSRTPRSLATLNSPDNAPTSIIVNSEPLNKVNRNSAWIISVGRYKSWTANIALGDAFACFICCKGTHADRLFINGLGGRQRQLDHFCGEEIARIRKLVGPTAQAIGAVSLVNNSAMRLNECKQVKETLAQHLGISLTVVDAADRSATNDTSANI